MKHTPDSRVESAISTRIREEKFSAIKFNESKNLFSRFQSGDMNFFDKHCKVGLNLFPKRNLILHLKGSIE